MAKRTQHQWRADEVESSDEQRRPSRSEKKRQADRLTQLGVSLVDLNRKAFANLEMHEELRSAIVACRDLKRGNARVRQTRLIGKLLRKHDTDALIAALASISDDKRERIAIARVQKDQSAEHPPDTRPDDKATDPE